MTDTSEERQYLSACLDPKIPASDFEDLASLSTEEDDVDGFSINKAK